MSTLTAALLVFIISFAGSMMQAVVGFGYVILCMALFPMFLPISQCLVVAQVGGFFMGLWMLWGKLRQVNLRYVLWPALFASLGSLAGLLFLKSVAGGGYLRALGVLLVLLALWMWKLSARVHIKPSPLSGGICGLLGGVMGSVFGVSVPPLVLYYSSNMSDKDSYMLPLQLTLAIQTGVCLLGRAALGMWPGGVWGMLPAAVLGCLLGKFPGRLIYGRLRVERLKAVIYLFVALLGVYTFLSN